MTVSSVRAELASEGQTSVISPAIGITKAELVRRGIMLEEKM
jgi:hypothetical protein